MCWALATAPSTFAGQIVDLATYPDAFHVQSMQLQDGIGAEIISCDVNGDGLTDLLLAATIADGVNFSRGAAGEIWLVLGARKRWSGTRSIQDVAAVRIIGQQEFHSFGASVACADLNSDGFADIAGGTTQADSLNNTRDQAGQVHIVFGATSLPAVIDLAQPQGTTVYGAEDFDGLGDELVTGDINGDGRPDLLLDASHATYKPTNQTQAGKVHVLFGKTSWPSSIDLRTASDLTIRGSTKGDNFGFQIKAGDIDLDGTDELIIDAPGSDRPGTTRSSSGSVYVWRGRSTWPLLIGLATSQPDLLIYGADAEDQFGRASMGVADWDVDGTPDLLLSGPYADGPTNTISDVGEMRSVELGSNWPPTVDLRTTYSRILYGVDTQDDTCNRFHLGDVNGDRVPDLTCSASDAGGPDESRWHSGECSTVFGRSGLSTDIRLANGDYDILIYGAAQQDSITSSKFTTDINNDGIQEIAIRGNYSVPGRLSDVYLVSPVDIDGDGFSQLADNCPLVANSDQLDPDGDLRGDACALDWDGDAIADSLDCAPNRPDAGRPPSIGPVAVDHNKSLAITRVLWPLQPSADRYDVGRGLVTQLAPGAFGACQSARDPDATDGEFVDDQSPPIGNSFFYLVRGIDSGCGGNGSWGTTSAGLERINSDPSACQ